MLLALDCASELQQMINVYSEASLRSLGPDGWIPADLMSEPQVPQHPVIGICLNPIHTSVVADPQTVELGSNGLGLARHACFVSKRIVTAHRQDQGDFDALEPWVNGHQIAWDTRVHHLTSLVVSWRWSKNLSTRCATILLQQGVPVHKVAQKVDDLLSRCEETEIVSVENKASLSKEKLTLVDLAAKHKVDLYGEAKGKGKGSTKSRRTSKKPSKGSPTAVPRASDFQLELGTFQYADSAPADVAHRDQHQDHGGCSAVIRRGRSMACATSIHT